MKSEINIPYFVRTVTVLILPIVCIIWGSALKGQSENLEVYNDSAKSMTIIEKTTMNDNDADLIENSIPDQHLINNKDFTSYPAFEFVVFPNPVTTGEEIKIQLNIFGKREVLVMVINQNGQEIYSNVMMTDYDGTVTDIEDLGNLNSGTYFLVVNTYTDMHKEKFIVK